MRYMGGQMNHDNGAGFGVYQPVMRGPGGDIQFGYVIEGMWSPVVCEATTGPYIVGPRDLAEEQTDVKGQFRGE